MSARLREAVERAFGATLRARGLTLAREASDGIGSSRIYEGGNLALRFSEERGALSVELGPRALPGRFRPFEAFAEFFAPPPRGRLNLPFAECARRLDALWERLDASLAPDGAEEFLRELDGRQRKP